MKRAPDRHDPGGRYCLDGGSRIGKLSSVGPSRMTDLHHERKASLFSCWRIELAATIGSQLGLQLTIVRTHIDKWPGDAIRSCVPAASLSPAAREKLGVLAPPARDPRHEEKGVWPMGGAVPRGETMPVCSSAERWPSRRGRDASLGSRGSPRARPPTAPEVVLRAPNGGLSPTSSK